MSAQIQETTAADVAEDFEVLDIDDPMLLVKHNINVC